MKCILKSTVGMAVLAMSFAGSPAYAQFDGQDVNNSTPITSEVSVTPENISALIETLAGGSPIITQVRFFANGELLADGYSPSIERREGSFNTSMKTLSIFGTFGGFPIVEDVRFVEHEGVFYVLDDVYLDNASVLATPGRALPHRLKTELAPNREKATGTDVLPTMAATAPKAAPAPVLTSIAGANVTGIAANGLIEISGPPCGTNDNSIRIVNANTTSAPYKDYLQTPFGWSLNGSNFGSNQGTIKLGPATITIIKWGPTQIAFLPLFSGGYTPLTPGAFSDTPLVLSVTTAATSTYASATTSYAITVGSAYGTRVFGQCTWYAAYLRIIMGKLPPEVPFPQNPNPQTAAGWAAMGPSYVPQVGDVLVWTWGNGAHQHTATVTQVTQTAAKTWKVTIGEMNYNCGNGVTSTTSTFLGTTGTWSSLSTMAVSGVAPYAYFH